MKKSFFTLCSTLLLHGLLTAQTGSLDPGFTIGTGADNTVRAFRIQPDGKTITAGVFTQYNGTSANTILRLNADGTIDNTFNAGTGANATINSLALQTDGKVLIGGSFTVYNGISRNYIARLNADGTIDAGFNPGTGGNQRVEAIIVQPDGKILIGGAFNSYNATARGRVARLNADGSLDASFNPSSGANNIVEAMALQSDGKVIIGGLFTTYNATTRNRIARLNTDGSLDVSFNPGTGVNNTIWDMCLQPDGNLLISGEFTLYNGTSRSRIARVLPNGTLDATFNPGTGLYALSGAIGRRITLHGGGKVLVTGAFTSVNGTTRNRIARLNPDGSLDAGFNPGTGMGNGEGWAIAARPNGKVLIGGSFTLFAGGTKNRIVQLLGDDCPALAVNFGDACDDGDPNTVGDAYDNNCTCVGICNGNKVVLKINTDANADQLGWEFSDDSQNPIAVGSLSASDNNSAVVREVCMEDHDAGPACYGFRLTDSFGDGITNGGWELRTTDGKLILGDSFASLGNSPADPSATVSYGTTHGFCLPLGPVNILANECGIFNNALGNKVYCNKPVGATQYEFEFSDPDAGFLRRVTVNRNYVIFSELGSNITPGLKYFARVRTNVAGPLASAHWGSGCEMGLGVAEVVTCSELIQAPAYGHSCNESRAFNTNNSFIYAKPVNGANEYQFRIYNLNEGYDQTFTRSTYILQLKWTNMVAPALVNGSTYSVEINTKVNGLYTGFCPSSCTISIDNSIPNMEQIAFGEATLWPNPVSDGQVNLIIGGIQDADQHISVDVQDLYGKQVFAQEFGNSGERFNTILQLPGDVASGVYLVNITVNGQRTVQRLSIIR